MGIVRNDFDVGQGSKEYVKESLYLLIQTSVQCRDLYVSGFFRHRVYRKVGLDVPFPIIEL